MFFFLHFYADLPSEDVARDQTVPLPVEDKVNGGDVSDPSENGEVEEVTKPIVDVIVDDAKDSQPQLVDSDVEIMQANVVEEVAHPKLVDSNVEIAQVVATMEVSKDSQQEAVDAKQSYASIVSNYTRVDFYKMYGLFGKLSFGNCKLYRIVSIELGSFSFFTYALEMVSLRAHPCDLFIHLTKQD